MTLRLTGLIAAVPIVVALAACSSSSKGAGTSTSAPPSSSDAITTSTATSTSTSTAGQSTAPSSNSAFPTSTAPASSGSGAGANKLFDRMATATKSVRSLHLTSDTTAATVKVATDGDEKLVAGKVVAFDLTAASAGSAPLRFIQVNGKTYGKLPASVTKSGKRYVLISTHSSNATVRQLATSLAASSSSSSPSSYSLFAKAAAKLTDRGAVTIGGVATRHYSFAVIPARLPANFPNGAVLVRSGIASIPVDLYVDSQDRPVRVTETVKAQGQVVTVIATFSKYNVPVSISAPPASQVTIG